MLGIRGALMLDIRGALMLGTKGTLGLVVKDALVSDSCGERRWEQKWLWYRIGRMVGRKDRGP